MANVRAPRRLGHLGNASEYSVAPWHSHARRTAPADKGVSQRPGVTSAVKPRVPAKDGKAVRPLPRVAQQANKENASGSQSSASRGGNLAASSNKPDFGLGKNPNVTKKPPVRASRGLPTPAASSRATPPPRPGVTTPAAAPAAQVGRPRGRSRAAGGSEGGPVVRKTSRDAVAGKGVALEQVRTLRKRNGTDRLRAATRPPDGTEARPARPASQPKEQGRSPRVAAPQENPRSPRVTSTPRQAVPAAQPKPQPRAVRLVRGDAQHPRQQKSATTQPSGAPRNPRYVAAPGKATRTPPRVASLSTVSSRGREVGASQATWSNPPVARPARVSKRPAASVVDVGKSNIPTLRDWRILWESLRGEGGMLDQSLGEPLNEVAGLLYAKELTKKPWVKSELQTLRTSIHAVRGQLPTQDSTISGYLARVDAALAKMP